MKLNCECPGYTLAQTEKLVGLSRPMLEYLCRLGIVRPTAASCRGRGRKRLYGFADLVLLRVVSRLLSNGISVARMRAGLTGLRKRCPELASALQKSVLVTDGVRVYLLDKNGSLEELQFGQLAFAFVVELSGIHSDLTIKKRKFDREFAAEISKKRASQK